MGFTVDTQALHNNIPYFCKIKIPIYYYQVKGYIPMILEDIDVLAELIRHSRPSSSVLIIRFSLMQRTASLLNKNQHFKNNFSLFLVRNISYCGDMQTKCSFRTKLTNRHKSLQFINSRKKSCIVGDNEYRIQVK